MATKKKHPIPDDCTSMMCNDLGSKDCWECSHAIFWGRSRVDGVMYRWIFEPYNGVSFLTKGGDFLPISKTPGKNHPVWKRFSAWQKRRGLRNI